MGRHCLDAAPGLRSRTPPGPKLIHGALVPALLVWDCKQGTLRNTSQAWESPWT